MPPFCEKMRLQGAATKVGAGSCRFRDLRHVSTNNLNEVFLPYIFLQARAGTKGAIF